MLRKLSLALVACLSVTLICVGASALVTAPIGRINNTDPGNGLPWQYYCQLRGSNQLNAVYIGSGVVVGAGHVGGPQDCEINGTVYPFVAGSQIEVPNLWYQANHNPIIDIIAWRISPYPNLPDLKITPVAPSIGTQLTVVADHGTSIGTTTVEINGVTCWNAVGGGGRHWGHVTLSRVDVGYNSFARESAYIGAWNMSQDDDAMLTYGDSGSPVFHQVGGVWYFTGIAVGLGYVTGQDVSTQVCNGEYVIVAPAASIKSWLEMMRSGAYVGSHGLGSFGGSGAGH